MESPFTLEILGNSHFRLRREGEDVQRVFSSVKEALDYARKVSDEVGLVFERKWEEGHRLSTANHSLVAGPAEFTSLANSPDYEFAEPVRHF